MKNTIQQRPLSLFLMTLLLSAGVIFPTIRLQAQEPVRIGLITPLSGAGSAYGPEMVKAAEVTASHINTAGGILQGRALQLIVEDSKTDAAEAIRAARKLIDDDRVVAIAAMWGSGPTLAVKALAIEKGIAVTTVGAADAITTGNDKQLIWRFQTAGHDWGVPAAKAILAAGHKKVSVLSLRNPFTSATVGPFIEAIETAGGGILHNIEFDPEESQAELTAQIGEVFADNPDAVFIPAYGDQLSAIVQQTGGANNDKIYTFSIAASSGSNGNSRFIQNVGPEAANGIHHLQPSIQRARPEYQAFMQNMSEDSASLNSFAALAGDQIALLTLAMEKAGSTDATVFAREIPGIANEPGTQTGDVVEALQLIRQNEELDYTGIALDISFDTNGSLVNRPFALYQIRNGRDVEVNLIE